MIDVQVASDADFTNVTIVGDVVFDTVSQVLAAVQGVPSTPALTVDLSGLKSFDLCGAQLLLSLEKTADSAGAQFTWVLGPAGERLNRMTSFAGLPAFKGSDTE